MITTILDALGSLLIIAGFAVIIATVTGYGLPAGLIAAGLMILVFSWAIARRGGGKR